MNLTSTYQLKDKDENNLNFSIRNIPKSYMEYLIRIHKKRARGVQSCIGLYVTIRNKCIENVRDKLSISEHELLKSILDGKKFNSDFATIEYIEQQMHVVESDKNEQLLEKLKQLHPADLYFLIENIMIE